MSGDFRDLDEVIRAPAKELPIGGKVYRFPDRVSGRVGLALLRVRQAAATGRQDKTAAIEIVKGVLGDDGEAEVEAALLGEADDQMASDGVGPEQRQHVLQTLIVWHIGGKDAAVAAWHGSGEAQAPNRAARRAVPKATARSARRASTVGTTTRAKGKPANRSATTRS